MKILVTGAAGFIGFHLSRHLLEKGHEVVGLDNVNSYYDVRLKEARLSELGVGRYQTGTLSQSTTFEHFRFLACDLSDRDRVAGLFSGEGFDVVCNLAAQAGVRYSLEAPSQYIESNVDGFLNILECCRHYNVGKLVFASSSSVYGANAKIPFSVNDTTDHPISLYAATKKSNELMAHVYSHLFGITTIGLRFFTVYGPWGRPDMAMFLFTSAILEGRPIDVFNEGNLERDFTYVDDVVRGVAATLLEDRPGLPKYRLYNIGNSRPVKLMDFIEAIEDATGRKAEKRMLPMQPGDVSRTWADVAELQADYQYRPDTDVRTGVNRFVEWYRDYYKI